MNISFGSYLRAIIRLHPPPNLTQPILQMK